MYKLNELQQQQKIYIIFIMYLSEKIWFNYLHLHIKINIIYL